MTYLELVNKVLVRLRESQVTTVSQNVYSTMVGAFVNDAKKEMEQAWDWSQNRSIIAVSTTDTVSTVTLTGFGQEGKVISAYNSSGKVQLLQQSQAWFDRQNYTGEVSSGSTSKFCFRGEDSSNDSIIEVWPTPDGVYDLKFNVEVVQDDLSADGTEIQIPFRPVYLMAVAMLAEEKGETGGKTSARYFETADKALADAIAFDAAKHPNENIWYEV
jgi:hypothetical protein